MQKAIQRVTKYDKKGGQVSNVGDDENRLFVNIYNNQSVSI